VVRALRRIATAAGVSPAAVRVGLLVVAVACALAAPAVARADWENLIAPESVCHGQSNAALPLATQKAAMRCLTNFARANAHRLYPTLYPQLRPLAASSRLGQVAQAKAAAMMTCQLFTHFVYVQDGRCRTDSATKQLELFGHGCFSNYGENIAEGGGSFGAPRVFMNWWLNSPGHRANILSRTFNAVGFGAAHGTGSASSVVVWSTDFGFTTSCRG
jgi:uncharacterized protein YkwD